MQPIILHGDDLIRSRQKLTEIIKEARDNNFNVVEVAWNASRKVELLTLARSQSMLVGEDLLVVENFFTNNKKAQEILKEVTQGASAHLVFWEGKPLGIKLKGLNKLCSIHEFKLPQVLFKFLESISPANQSESLRLMGRLSFDPEFLLLMVARQVRYLLWAKEDHESLELPVWQKRNLIAQADKFKTQTLLKMHDELLNLDKKNKTSQIDDLYESLRLFVATL